MNSIHRPIYEYKSINAWIFAVSLIGNGLLSSATADSTTDSIADSLKGDWGQIKLNLNWRYENVDQQGLGI